MGLLAFSGRPMESPPNSIKPDDCNREEEWKDKIHLTNKIDIAMRSFANTVKNNNGIKEKNILGLLLPLGVAANTLDHTWLVAMNNFGIIRGDAAHKSARKIFTTQQINPADEWQAFKSLLRTGLCKVDDNIEKIITKL